MLKAKKEMTIMKLRKVRALLDHKKFAEELKKLGKTQEEFAEDILKRNLKKSEPTADWR